MKPEYWLFYLIFLFHFLFDLFFYFELRVRVRGDVTITLSHISHSNDHKSQGYREGHRRFWKDDVITMCLIYGL